MKLVGDAKLQVKVMSPTQAFYEGPAMSVSASNAVGPFDILANHANFFSLLTQGPITVDTGAQKLTFNISRGIIKVHSNTITLLIYLLDSDTP